MATFEPLLSLIFWVRVLIKAVIKYDNTSGESKCPLRNTVTYQKYIDQNIPKYWKLKITQNPVHM